MVDVYNTHLQVPTSLEGAGSFINGISQTVIDELSKLKGQLSPIADSWTGDTFTFYQEEEQAWTVASDGLFGPEGVMGMIAHALNVNYNNYSEAELANTKTWKH